MNILFITRKFPPSVGGMEKFAEDVYRSVKKKTNIKLLAWGGSNKLLPLVMPYFLIRSLFILLTRRIDVIHAQDGIVSTLGFLLSKISSKPYAVVIHGLDITYKNKLYQAIVSRTVKSADIVFCISQAAADESIARGVPKSKIKVIPLGIEDLPSTTKKEARENLNKKFNISTNRKILLTTGRLVKRKGVKWFIINVLPKIVKKHPKTLYLIAGDGEERSNIEQAVYDTRMGKHVKLLGRVEDKTISLLYNGSDVFIQPNIPVANDIEGFGRVLLEASILRLPVVASDMEGIKDAISNHKNGVLVNSKNINEFVKEINKFIANKEYAKQFGETSRRYTLKNYNWDKISTEYIETYKSILNK